MNSGESPAAEDQDEELRRKAETWLVSMCESGRASYGSDPQRIGDYLQKEGNEKHKLGIKINMEFIKEQLRISDGEMKEKSKGRRQRVLFIRRELQRTDTRDHQNRLSMPCSQVNEEVLTAGGEGGDGGGGEGSGGADRSPWNEIRRDNGFRAGMVMNIWGFRGERGKLCFQLETDPSNYSASAI